MTLHASLLARLDYLGRAREAAQVDAALGRRFSHQLIGAVAAEPPGTSTMPWRSWWAPGGFLVTPTQRLRMRMMH
jgi:hypothetical protein